MNKKAPFVSSSQVFYQLSNEVLPGPRVAIIGAGATGLEAAHIARQFGLQVRLFEQEPTHVSSLLRQSHLDVAVNWRTIISELGHAVLVNSLRNSPLVSPNPEHCPTSEEAVRRYYDLMADSLPPNTLYTDTRVVGVSRTYLQKDDPAILKDARNGIPFRLLTRNCATGEERHWSADFVIDCTSNGKVPAWAGSAGLPAIGEMGSSHKIFRHVPDILGKDRIHFVNRKTLVIGNHPYAALTITMLAKLSEKSENTKMMWTLGSKSELPFNLRETEIGDSRNLIPLQNANLLVKSLPSYLSYSSNTHIEELRYRQQTEKFLVTMQIGHQTKRYQFDNVIANVGFRHEPAYINQLIDGETGFYRVVPPSENGILDRIVQSRECISSIISDIRRLMISELKPRHDRLE